MPEFYNRNEKEIPTAWIARMRESMAQLTPRFSADRTVKEYTEKHYLPAAKAFIERAAQKGKKGEQIANLLHTLRQHWDGMHFGEINIGTTEKSHEFEVPVYFNAINPDTVQVELYANGTNGEAPPIHKMVRGKNTGITDNGYIFKASVASTRPSSDYTPRIIPNFPDISVPLETNLILWQS